MPIQLPGGIQSLFNPVMMPNIVQKGSLIVFRYIGQTGRMIHDPYPMVIVSDIFTDKIRGVNLHYLTLPTIKEIIRTYGNKQFSYAYIKNSSYIVGAFRSYKRLGISQLKMLDVNFVQKVLEVARATYPGEVDQIRDQIHQLIQEANQPKAGE